MTLKKVKTELFGDLRIGDHFVLFGEYLQRGLFDNPKIPIVRVKVSPLLYIEARMLEKGKIPTDRLKDITRKISLNNIVIKVPRGNRK